jgi:transcription initiation factor TFIIIB Brf1 subunit/transcription initiation factor TFIIB
MNRVQSTADRRSLTPAAVLRRALRLVAQSEQVPVRAIRPYGRGRSQLARDTACYLAVVVKNVSPRKLDSVAGVSRTTIRRALARIEDLRDSPEFDRRLVQLEEAFHAEAN